MPPKNEICNSCGGFKFSITDGFKYCDRCGALLENFEELEDEDAGINQTKGQGKVKSGVKGPRKVVVPIHVPAPEVMAEAVERRSHFLRDQAVKNEELPIPHESTPDYLFRLAIRIFSFTQVLSKTSHILVKELNFRHEIQTTILSSFQRYLSHCGVAFCGSEQCGDDEKLRFVAVMENVFYEEQEREEKRRKKLERRGKGAKVLSKSAAAWTLLTQGNITENLDLGSSDSEEDKNIHPDMTTDMSKSLGNLDISDINDVTHDINDTTMGFVRKVTTALSKEALRRASQFFLNLELFVAVIHSGLLLAGYRNILVSDIIRWVREDRFRISRRAIRLFRQSAPERQKKSEKHEFATSMESRGDAFLRLPLYEIVRTCTIYHQSLKLEKKMVPLKFETLATRLIDNLNLPIDFLSRMLLLESIVPCDISPSLLSQANISMGSNFRKLAESDPKQYYKAFMTSFGRKERTVLESDSCDEVLISVDTKMISYVLLVIRMTFDIDSDTVSVTSPNQFDIDTWIYQLEMRIKCWQGHDMKRVMKPWSTVPNMIPDMPFGTSCSYHDGRGGPFIERRRRQIGFQKCIPSEMSFNSTATLPTVFDTRNNRFSTEKRQIQAIISPLKFQRILMKKEIEMDQKSYDSVDPEAKKTFFQDFTNFKTTESAESFDDYFPCASRYSIYRRPDWMQNCAARKSAIGPKTGPFRLYLNNETCEDLLKVARPSFSRRFEFLLESLSLLIGEDQKAVYAAFLMLEMHLTQAKTMESIRLALLSGSPISIDCQRYSSTMYHAPLKKNIVREESNEEWFWIFDQKCEENEIEEIHPFIDSRNCEIREKLTQLEKEKVQKYLKKICYDFETFFAILAVKFW